MEEKPLKPFVRKEFKIDLQLFGGGGGKKAAKVILTIGAFFAGAGGVGMAFFGTSSSIAGGLMGMSLFSSVWALGSKKDSGGSGGSPSIMRFDREQEAMSLGGVIPVVYGRRMISGNQTYHETDAEANNLHKHVVLCEGGVEGLETVTAQGFNIPILNASNVRSLAVFTIQNFKYPDAYVRMDGKTLILHCNGKNRSIALKNEADMTSGASYYAWQVETGSLIAYINRMGDGWEAFPTATTSRYPGDMIVGVYSGRSSYRTDGGDPFPDRFQSNGCIYIVVPGTRRSEHHWHHFHHRTSHIATVDVYSPATKKCYKTPADVMTTSCVGVTEMSYYDGQAPSNYKDVGSYTNMAWLDLKFVVSDNLGGNPNIQALMKGRKVYDTRKKAWVYSTNPAMCLRDLLLNRSYGAGRWITTNDLDEDSFKEAADWCDTLVTYELMDGTRVETKRYELNLVMDNKQTVWDWAQSIMATFCGYFVLSKNKLHLRIEKATASSYSFDESTINELSLSQASLEECPNQYRVKFIDPLNNWKTATIVVDDASDQRERQRVIVKEVELEGVTSQAQALRLARFYRDYNKVCTLQVEFKTGYEAVHLEPGDVITLTYKKVFYKAPFRITEIRETENGEYTIRGRQYNESIYNDTLGAMITTYNYATMKPTFGKPLAPSNVKVTVLDDVLEYPITRLNARISWTESKTNLNSTYNVYRRYSGESDWTFIGNTPSNSFVVQEKQDTQAQYAVITLSGMGLQSSRVSCDLTRLYLTDTPPAAPSNVVISTSGATVSAVWERNTEGDFDHYEVTFGNKTYTTSDPSFSGKGKDGRNDLSIVAVDKGKNKSKATQKTVYMTIKPEDIVFVAVEKYNGYVTLKWPESTGATYYTITGAASLVTRETEVSIFVGKTGSYTYYVTACNDYDTSKKYKVDVSYTKEDDSTGTDIYDTDLFEGITLDSNTEFVFEDDKNTIVKKEIE